MVAGVLPASRIQAVYFQSTSDLEEHVAREYENIRNDTVPLLRISPERFMGPAVEVELLLEALARINETIIEVPSEMVSRLDSLGGALLMLGGLVSHDSEVSLSTLISPLETLQNSVNVAETLKVMQGIADDEKWIALLPPLLEQPEMIAGIGEDLKMLSQLSVPVHLQVTTLWPFCFLWPQ